MNIFGKIKITVNILITAPLAIRLHKDPMISTSEYKPTPNVAAKKPTALTMMEGMDVESAI